MPLMPEEFLGNDQLETIFYKEFLNLDRNDVDWGYYPIVVPESDRDNLDLFILKFIRKPENIYFTCKHIFNIELPPIQCVILQNLWTHAFPMLIASRGLGKTFLLALYCLVRALVDPGIKIVVVGAGFRQARFVFNYMTTIYNNAPIFQDLLKRYDGENYQGPRTTVDMCIFGVGASTISCIPMGDGEKIRGLRANIIVCDEFSSINREVYEKVVSGFTSVTSTPIDNIKLMAKMRTLQGAGLIKSSNLSSLIKSNQSIISGTASYDFQHFYEYYKKYKDVIESAGDEYALRNLFGEDIDPSKFNYKDFCVMQIPYDVLPEGFMDEKSILRAKSLVHSGTFAMEYGATFCSDSTGFFKRSLIEHCTVNQNGILINDEYVCFEPMLSGAPHKEYIMGVDPASESDNLAIVILEINKGYRKIVYSFTTNRKRYKEDSTISESNFFAYCARKIRILLEKFNVVHIAMDAQGGGIAIMEALHDSDKLYSENEQMIWPVTKDHPLWDGKERETDMHSGRHIIEVVQFARADYVAGANNGLKKDFEDRVLLFPWYDASHIIEGAVSSKKESKKDNKDNKGDNVDIDSLIPRKNFSSTYEDVMFEIEEIKNELVTIVHTRTQNGRDRWDTPEVKIGGAASSKKGRLRKDRYSALMIANMAARSLKENEVTSFRAVGSTEGASLNMKSENKTLYVGPDWFTQKANEYLKYL